MGTQGRFPRWLRTSDADGPSCVFQPDPAARPLSHFPEDPSSWPSSSDLRLLPEQTAHCLTYILISYPCSWGGALCFSNILNSRSLPGLLGPQLLARRRPRLGALGAPPPHPDALPLRARSASLLPSAPGSFCTLSSALVTGPSTQSPSVQSTPAGPQGRAGGSSLSPSGSGGAAFQGAIPSRLGTEAPVQPVSPAR